MCEFGHITSELDVRGICSGPSTTSTQEHAHKQGHKAAMDNAPSIDAQAQPPPAQSNDTATSIFFNDIVWSGLLWVVCGISCLCVCWICLFCVVYLNLLCLSCIICDHSIIIRPATMKTSTYALDGLHSPSPTTSSCYTITVHSHLLAFLIHFIRRVSSWTAFS